MFLNPTTGTYWEDADDSLMGGFVNLSFDGSYSSFAPYSPYTCYEASHFVLFYCRRTLAGRNKPLLENVVFSENVTSNYATGTNTVITTYNVTHTHSVIDFGNQKADFSFVGGNITAVHQSETTVRGIDSEQNYGGYGYYSDYRQDLTLNDCTIPIFQVGTIPVVTDTFEAADIDLAANTIAISSSFDSHAVVFSTTGTLPAPLAVETVYYLDEVGTSNVFAIQETPTGDDINLTDVGIGTHTVTVNAGTRLLTFNDCAIEDIYVYAPGATVAVNRGTITPNNYGAGGNYTFLASAASFTATGVTVNMSEGTQTTRGGIPWNHTLSPTGTWKFDTCIFNKVGTWSVPVAVFMNSGISLGLLGNLILDTCTFNNFSGSDDWIVYYGNGGRVSIIEPTLVNCTNFVNFYGLGPSYYGKLSVTGPFTADALTTYLLTRVLSLSSDLRLNVIEHVLADGAATVILPSTQALIMSGQVASDGAGIREFDFDGKRRITSASAPTVNDTGLPGDEWYNTVSSAVTHTVVVTGDYDEVNSGWKKVRDTAPTYYDTTWTEVTP